VGAADLPRRPLSDRFLHVAIVPANAYQDTKFQLPSSNSFRDNLIWGLLRPCRTPYAETFMYAPSTWQGKNSQPDFNVVSLCIMQLCEYVFPVGFPLYVPKNGVWGGFEGENVKIMCSNPQKALLCVNTRLLVYRVSKSVQRPEL